MAISVISNTLTSPSSDPAPNFTVNARLTTVAGQSGGFRLNGGTTEIASIVTTTALAGVWSLGLENNSNVTPTGSYYVIEEQAPSSFGGTREWACISSTSAATATLFQSLANPIPDAGGSFALTETLADARYGQLAAPNIWTSSNTFSAGAIFTGTETHTGPETHSGTVTFTGTVNILTSTSGNTGWFSVKSYGAQGDGITDDTTDIQAAIDACSAAGGGTVYFPAGTYLVTLSSASTARCLQLKSSIRYLGAGPASVIKLKDNAAGNASGTRVMASAAQTSDTVHAGSSIIGSTVATGITVANGANFTIGDYLSDSGLGALEILQVTNIVGNTLTVTRGMVGTTATTNWAAGFALQKQYHDMVVENLVVDGNYANQSSFAVDQDDGIFLGPGFSNKVTRCEVRNCRADGVYLFLSQASLGAHNTVHDCQRVGMNMRGSSWAEYSANHIYNIGAFAMKMEEQAGDIPCVGNNFANNICWNTFGLVSLSGVGGGRLTDMTIIGNYWNGPSTTGSNAIILGICDRITVQANQLIGGFGSSIIVQRDATFIKILDNQISGLGDPNTTLVGAILLGGGSTTGVQDILVKGNTIYQAPQAGIQLVPTANVTKQPLRVIIEDNHIESCGFQGIDFVSGDDCQIRGNVIYGNGSAVAGSTVAGGSQAGIFFRAGSVVPNRPLVIGNTFVGSASQTKGIAGQDASANDVTIILNNFTVSGTPIGSSSFCSGTFQSGINYGLGGPGAPAVFGSLHGIFTT